MAKSVHLQSSPSETSLRCCQVLACMLTTAQKRRAGRPSQPVPANSVPRQVPSLYAEVRVNKVKIVQDVNRPCSPRRGRLLSALTSLIHRGSVVLEDEQNEVV